MGVHTVWGWLVAVSVLTVYCSASQHQVVKSKDTFCILKEQASSKQPPAVCNPPERCDAAPLLQHYGNVQKECLVNAAKRRDDQAAYLFQLNYWHGDLLFFFNLLKKYTTENASLTVDIERIDEVDVQAKTELERKHLVYSIEAGRLRHAMLAYLTMPTQLTPKEIVQLISGNPIVDEAVLLNFLHFVRAVPEEAPRLEFYKAFKHILYKYDMQKNYMALLYSVEVFPLVSGTKDYKQYYTDVMDYDLKKWKEQMFKNSYLELIWIEKHFPDYFAFVIPSLTVFTRDEWTKRLDQKEMYAQVNFLSRMPNRLTMYERIMDNTKVHGIGKRFNTDNEVKDMLGSFANQLERLQNDLVKNGKDKQLMQRLILIKQAFGKLYKRRGRGHWNFDTYLHFFKTRGKMPSRSG